MGLTHCHILSKTATASLNEETLRSYYLSCTTLSLTRGGQKAHAQSCGDDFLRARCAVCVLHQRRIRRACCEYGRAMFIRWRRRQTDGGRLHNGGVVAAWAWLGRWFNGGVGIAWRRAWTEAATFGMNVSITAALRPWLPRTATPLALPPRCLSLPVLRLSARSCIYPATHVFHGATAYHA